LFFGFAGYGVGLWQKDTEHLNTHTHLISLGKNYKQNPINVTLQINISQNGTSNITLTDQVFWRIFKP
jgi:hypothetical protein